MSDLLEKAIAAHGGSERWSQARQITADASITGVLWHLKGRAGIIDRARITADPHDQRVEYSPFRSADQHSLYVPGKTSVVTDAGETVEFREAPRLAFDGHELTTPWDDHHLIYFAGYAMWTYLTTPFLFSMPGFETKEVEPWDENGEEWRRLRVIFPESVHSHSPVQTFYFDAQGILKRHDYSADVLGGSTTAHYVLEPKTFDGIVFPTKRRAYSAGPDNRPIAERLAISIDFHHISIA